MTKRVHPLHIHSMSFLTFPYSHSIHRNSNEDGCHFLYFPNGAILIEYYGSGSGAWPCAVLTTSCSVIFSSGRALDRGQRLVFVRHYWGVLMLPHIVCFLFDLFWSSLSKCRHHGGPFRIWKCLLNSYASRDLPWRG